MPLLPAAKISAWIENNFEFRTRRGGEEYLICNPFDGDTDFKFNINPEKNACHDWRGDQWAGVNKQTGKRSKCSFIKFVQLYLKCTYPQAVRAVLQHDATAYLLRKKPEEQQQLSEVQISLPAGSKPIRDNGSLASDFMISWLASRGFGNDAIITYDLHQRGTTIVWPYYEFEELVYWQCRQVVNKNFEFPPLSVGVGKGDFLFGFDLVEPASYVIITEAIFDAMSLGDQTLASGGAQLTETQIKKLGILGPKDGVILAPDRDKAGIESIDYNAALLKARGWKLFYSLPPTPYKDWNELLVAVGREATLAAFDKGISAITPISLFQLKTGLR